MYEPRDDIAPGYDSEWYLSCRKVRRGECFVNGTFRPEEFIKETIEAEHPVGLVVAGGFANLHPSYSSDVAEMLDIVGKIPPGIDKILCVNSREPVKTMLPSEMLGNCIVLYDAHGELDALVESDVLISHRSQRFYEGEVDENVLDSVCKSMIGSIAHPLSRMFYSLQHGQWHFDGDSVMDSETQSQALSLFSDDNISMSSECFRDTPGSWALQREAFLPIARTSKSTDALLKQIDELYVLWQEYAAFVGNDHDERVSNLASLLRHMELHGYGSYVDAYFAGVPIEDLFA